MDLKDFGKEALTITVVLVIVAAVAFFFGGIDRGFLRDLASEWMWWVGILLVMVVVFGGWQALRRRRP